MATRSTCRYIVISFAVLYSIALGVFIIGTFGLFGYERDALSGVFLVPLGLPWNLLIGDVTAEYLWSSLAALAPGVNLVILITVCSCRSSREKE